MATHVRSIAREAKGVGDRREVSSKYHQSDVVPPMVEQVGDMGRRTNHLHAARLFQRFSFSQVALRLRGILRGDRRVESSDSRKFRA
jgi:hypothetical protein